MNSFLIPSAGLVAGILSAYFGMTSWAGGVILFLALLLNLALQIMSRKASAAYRLAPLHHAWIGLLFFGIGVIDRNIQAPSEEPLEKVRGVARGEILEKQYLTSGERYLIRLSEVTDHDGRTIDASNIKCRLDAGSVTSIPTYSLRPGDVVEFDADFKRIEHVDGITSLTYVRIMHNRDILYTQRIDRGYPVCIGHNWRLLNHARELRDKIEIFIETSGLSRHTAHFLITVMLGDKEYLDAQLRESFADAGISHMLALSGMHVGIITAIILALLFPVNFTGRYKWRYGAATVALWGYVLITGAAPSTLRAAVMATFSFGALMLERRKSSFNGLLCSIFIISLVSPSALLDIGFQLSVVCVGSLIAFAEYYNPVDHRSHTILYKIISALIATICATLGSWASVAYHFGIFSPMFLLANIVVLPFLPLYVVSALLYFLLVAAGFRHGYFSMALDSIFDMLCRFTSFLSADGSGALSIEISEATVAIWLAGLLILAIGIHFKRSTVVRSVGYSLLILGIAAVWLCPPEAKARGLAVTRNTSDVDLYSFYGDRKILYSLSGEGIEHISCANIKIMKIADCDLDTMQTEGIKADYVIIGKNVRGDIGKFRKSGIRKVIIHNSLYSKAEKHMLSESDTTGVPLHSIRRDGVYVIPLTD